MLQEPTQQWRCQVCKRIFQDEDMLLGHTKSIEVRSQLVLQRMHQLMNEYQGLMKSWQEVLTHSESGSTSFDYDTSDDNDSKIPELTCPHPDCAAMPRTYTELRSLQRHFRNRSYVSFKGSCPSCKAKYDTTGRLHETHLQRCLKTRGNKRSREEATAQKHQITKDANRELKRLCKYGRIRKPTGKTANMGMLVPDVALPQVATSQTMEDMNIFSGSVHQPSMQNDGRFEAVPGLAESQPVSYPRGTAFDGFGRFPLDWSTESYHHQSSEPATLFSSSSGNCADDLVKLGLDMGNLR